MLNLLLAVVCLSQLVWAEENFLKHSHPKKPLESIGSLRVGTYNLLNLFEKKGKIHGAGPKELFTIFPEGRRPMEEALKSLENLKAQAKVIINNQYDVLAVVEVENLIALSAFSEQFLDGEYDSYLIEGNDPRGIDVGFLVRSSIPLEVEQRSHREETWNDPTLDGKKVRLFSRDLPSLIFRTSKNSKPAMIYFGTHFKSKRDRPNDPESRILRQAQVERASEIVKAYEKEFGTNVPLFLSGDFNGEIAREKEFVSLNRVASLTDSFDVVSPPLNEKERITHSYFPKDGRPKWAQLDAVLANQAGTKFVNDAKVPHYHDENGNEIPVPQSYDELKKSQPSDHYPVHVELDFKNLIR
ncbi:MAG: endonuclease/exonuclease/phosphatase family protein [Pseudomonadota bacterium]